MATNKRERQLARMRTERQTARRQALAAQRRQRRIAVGTGVGVALLVLVAVGAYYVFRPAAKKTDTLATAKPGATASPSASASAAPAAPKKIACGGKKPPAPVKQTFAKEPPLTIDRKATYVETIQTSCGTITATLDATRAPRTVNSFAFLASKKFFDGISISRTSGAGFPIAQLGDQESTGSGGPGYKVPDESLKGSTYTRGTLAMANSGPNTNGSQFFLVGGNAQLQPNYTVFGKIRTGLGVLDKIIKIGNDGSNPAGGGKPKETVYVESLRITKA